MCIRDRFHVVACLFVCLFVCWLVWLVVCLFQCLFVYVVCLFLSSLICFSVWFVLFVSFFSSRVNFFLCLWIMCTPINLKLSTTSFNNSQIWCPGAKVNFNFHGCFQTPQYFKIFSPTNNDSCYFWTPEMSQSWFFKKSLSKYVHDHYYFFKGAFCQRRTHKCCSVFLSN